MPSRLLTLTVVVAILSIAAATVRVEEASAYFGPKPWRYVNAGAGQGTAPGAYNPASYRNKIFRELQGVHPRMFPTFGDGAAGESRFASVLGKIRTAWGGFKPARFAGTISLSVNGAVGGYYAWKFCDSVVTSNCDFLGLREAIGSCGVAAFKWGCSTSRLTFGTGQYEWWFNSVDNYWYLRAGTGIFTCGTGARHCYLEKTFDGGATWTRPNSINDCGSAGSALACADAHDEVKAVFATATRGAIFTGPTQACPSGGTNNCRPVYRRIADADFQELIDGDGEYLMVPPDTTSWPGQFVTTFTKTTTDSDTAPDGDDDRWDYVVDHFFDMDDSDQTEIGRWVDPEWEGDDQFSMPDCHGMTTTECESALEDLGFTGTITYQLLDFYGADTTVDPASVTTTEPAADTTIAIDADVTFSVNPDPMPYVWPVPLPTETYADYVARLEADGYLGTVTGIELSEDQGDPRLGPSAPVVFAVPLITPGLADARTVTLPGGWPSTTSIRTKIDTNVTVYYNPPTYTPVSPEEVPPASGGTPGDGIPTRTIDFTPITGIDFGCKFPFGLICYAIDVTEIFNVTPDAPHFDFTLGTPAVGEAPYNVDLNVMDDYMTLIRGLISVALWVGGVYFLAANLLGFRMAGDPGEAADEGMNW